MLVHLEQLGFALETLGHRLREPLLKDEVALAAITIAADAYAALADVYLKDFEEEDLEDEEALMALIAATGEMAGRQADLDPMDEDDIRNHLELDDLDEIDPDWDGVLGDGDWYDMLFGGDV